MIIRTYSRRNKVTDSAYDGDKEIKFSGSLPHQSPRDIRNFEFSSQDSTPWSVELEPCNNSKKSFSINGFEGQISPKAKKPRNTDMETGGRWTCVPVLAEELHDEPLVSTATLMETQEFGELMENLDEVHFALDGLRKGLPLRIRRASLLSLLSISSTVQKRRLLRNQGTSERIIEAILGLAFDDMSSSLAAAALLFLFTSDAKDDHLLESSSGISFLLELLKPIKSKGPKCKGSTIGCKLLAVLKNPKVSHAATDDMDPNISSINFKVQEILVNSKELKSISGTHSITGRPELDPKWLALLTMEKASLSKFSLEASSGVVRKTGWDFKEKLREVGGLRAVFEIIQHCHAVVEEGKWNGKLQDNSDLHRSTVVLLRCLKIMENATFLSEENQKHLLLEMKGSSLFTEVIVKVIKTLSKAAAASGGRSGGSRSTKNGCMAADPFAFVEEGRELGPEKKLKHVEEEERRCCRTSTVLSCGSASSVPSGRLLLTSALSDCILAAVKVLMNITNDNSVGCRQIGSCSGALETLSSLLLSHHTRAFVSQEDLDFLVPVLGLLVNLVEKDERNRSGLAAATVLLPPCSAERAGEKDVIPLLCSIFIFNRQTSPPLLPPLPAEQRSLSENEEAAVVVQGQREAERMIVEAYAALLLAFLSTESKTARKAIARHLPGRTLSVLVPVLERFLVFHTTLNMISHDTYRAVNQVIESCRMP